MRITTPAPDARVDLDGIDLYDPLLYSQGDPHLVWQTLRARAPVFWNAGPAPGFWAVTRHQDVREVLRDHDTFTSEQGTVLWTLGIGDPAAGKMMAVTDPPRQRQLREAVGRPVAVHAVREHTGWLRELVRGIVEPAWDGGQWDAAAAFSRLPVATVLTLMRLPQEDVEPLLRWTYASAAPTDPNYQTGSMRWTLMRAHHQIMDYFRYWLRRRRLAPGNDLLSHLLTARAGDAPLTDDEIILNCYSLLLGGAVTTSQAITATLLALAEQGGGAGTWPAGTPADSAVEEALRWASPTTHFMRYARRDVQLHGVRIRAGDAVTAWIGSANRDDSVFAQPYRFDPARTDNHHLAFGGGAHYCIGHGLARLTLRVVVEEFFAKLERFELAGPPVHLVSNVAAGVVSAPIRVVRSSSASR
jgi:cytochrome P450